MVSSSLVMLACCATISLTCDMIVPKSEAAKRKRKLQKICAKQSSSQPGLSILIGTGKEGKTRSPSVEAKMSPASQRYVRSLDKAMMQSEAGSKIQCGHMRGIHTAQRKGNGENTVSYGRECSKNIVEADQLEQNKAVRHPRATGEFSCTTVSIGAESARHDKFWDRLVGEVQVGLTYALERFCKETTTSACFSSGHNHRNASRGPPTDQRPWRCRTSGRLLGCWPNHF
jgi:hypothetical protein